MPDNYSNRYDLCKCYMLDWAHETNSKWKNGWYTESFKLLKAPEVLGALKQLQSYEF